MPAVHLQTPATPVPGVDLAELAASLAPLRAGQRLRLLYETFGPRLVATTSFGIQAAAMLHLIAEHAPKVPVVFIDTGFLFPETYLYAEQLSARLELDLRIYQPNITSARLQALSGELWNAGKAGADKYAMLTKIEPLNRALRELGADVWLSGLRRSQSKTRADRPFAEQQKKTLKVYPILDWADAQMAQYFYEHELPAHPLAAEGYVTMGDWHSTRPADADAEAETTRFGGQKYECGLHLDSGTRDFQI
ncbi:MAG: phosphoadenylyl-sulfate reductase [Verrucomicrobia bacterium]|nr:MAG: phosphoadenylyl-sulfate reductase [Verrucomicrobiota bacterium]